MTVIDFLNMIRVMQIVAQIIFVLFSVALIWYIVEIIRERKGRGK